jgi:hypothetical membrane protein
MRIGSVICGLLGILVVIIAVIGRVQVGPTVKIFGAPSTHLVVAGNTLLLIGIFLGQLRPPDKKP